MARFCAGVILLCLSSPALAITATCEGDGWSLELLDAQARFAFPSPTDLDIPHVAFAEGRDWPRAYTLIGQRDSAIAILHDRACPGGSHEAQILTQRGQSPIMLQGCCRDVSE